MDDDKQLYVLTQLRAFADHQAIRDAVGDWLTLCQLLMTPQTYTVDETLPIKFDLASIKKKINTLGITEEEDTLLSVKGIDSEMSVHIFKGYVRERLLISEAVYQEFQSVIDDYITKRMEANGLYAYIRSLDEFLSHNIESIEERSEEKINTTPSLPKMFDSSRRIVIDCSQLPGYDNYFQGLCLTACWKMWYTSDYYYAIPKQAFLTIQQVDQIVEYENEVVQITLYDDPFAWEHPSNLRFQVGFRDQLGIDQLEWSNGVGVMREPCTEYVKMGASTQMIQYQNQSLQPTSKSQACHFTTRLYNYDSHQYREDRRFGSLNNRAYFPWRDATKKVMLAYWILNPRQMIDGGTRAYEFYIKQYVKAAVSDEETEGYHAVLRFYLPEDSLVSMSLDNLVTRLEKSRINVKKRYAESHLLQIETGEVDLYVEFLNVSELEEPNEVNQITSPLQTVRSWVKKQFSQRK